MGTLAQISERWLSIAYILLAIGVSVHVLLHKRDIGASIGWIGLAWLSPIVGSALYIAFGINRVKRRAIQLRSKRVGRHSASMAIPQGRDHHLDSLETAGNRITQRRLEQGNAIAVLHNGDEAYPEMIAEIDAARSSIALSTYIFRADGTGARFVEALARARKRGVDVRVLIDGIGGGYFWSPAYRHLRGKHVPVVRFMHSLWPWRMPFLNLRIHKKLLAVDGRIAFTGGLNIGAENVLAGQPRHPVRDTHFRIEGPVVAQMMADFAEDWLFASGEMLSGDAWFPALKDMGDAAARVVVSGPDQDIEKIEFMILEAVACAEYAIKVMTPYFLPNDRLVTALALAAMRGVEVDVVVPTRSDHIFMDWAMRAHIGPLIAAGCRIWRSPQPFDHSKLITVDSTWCLIGSANWDVRSFRLNFELNVEIYEANIARDLERSIIARSGTLVSAADLESLGIIAKLVDSSARLMLPYF